MPHPREIGALVAMLDQERSGRIRSAGPDAAQNLPRLRDPLEDPECGAHAARQGRVAGTAPSNRAHAARCRGAQQSRRGPARPRSVGGGAGELAARARPRPERRAGAHRCRERDEGARPARARRRPFTGARSSSIHAPPRRTTTSGTRSSSSAGMPRPRAVTGARSSSRRAMRISAATSAMSSGSRDVWKRPSRARSTRWRQIRPRASRTTTWAFALRAWDAERKRR